MKKVTILVLSLCVCMGLRGQVKVGIIGLDTSHSTAFTQLINGTDEGLAGEFRVVAAYSYGSQVIKSSVDRIPGCIEEVKKYGVEIVSSIAELIDRSDCILLETNDGQIHLEQAAEVFKSGKTCFIDKPLGATLGQAMAIYELAERYNVSIFSSSALRYSPQNQALRNGQFGKILGADCYSPHYDEPTHPDYGWYGIHGVETLYTVMGTGCQAVNRITTPGADIVSGIWSDGRAGTFRAIKEGPSIYGGTAFTADGAVEAGGYAGYQVLLEEILRFFKSGVPPVSKEETLEIFAFMEASILSDQRKGQIVPLSEAYEKGRKEAARLLKAYK